MGMGSFVFPDIADLAITGHLKVKTEEHNEVIILSRVPFDV